MGVLKGQYFEYFELSNHKAIFAWDNEWMSFCVYFFLFKHLVENSCRRDFCFA